MLARHYRHRNRPGIELTVVVKSSTERKPMQLTSASQTNSLGMHLEFLQVYSVSGLHVLLWQSAGLSSDLSVQSYQIIIKDLLY